MREEGREEERKGGREEGRKGGREGRREGGREEKREGGKEGGREEQEKGERDKEAQIHCTCTYTCSYVYYIPMQSHTCNVTRSSEVECLDEVSLRGWGYCRSCSSARSSGFRNRRSCTARTHKIRWSIRPLCTLSPTHTVTDVQAFYRLSEGTPNALHARHLCGLRTSAVVGGLDMDDVTFQEVYHRETIDTAYCHTGGEREGGRDRERDRGREGGRRGGRERGKEREGGRGREREGGREGGSYLGKNLAKECGGREMECKLTHSLWSFAMASVVVATLGKR